jgi:hypothetical protein
VLPAWLLADLALDNLVMCARVSDEDKEKMLKLHSSCKPFDRQGRLFATRRSHGSLHG